MAIAELRSLIETAEEFTLKRLTKEKCAVCGAPSVGFIGYVFFENGRTRIGITFCKEHLNCTWLYSNPAFENRQALALFQSEHLELYERFVKDRKILFLQPAKTEAANVK